LRSSKFGRKSKESDSEENNSKLLESSDKDESIIPSESSVRYLDPGEYAAQLEISRSLQEDGAKDGTGLVDSEWERLVLFSYYFNKFTF
jgi:hypothetical protein